MPAIWVPTRLVDQSDVAAPAPGDGEALLFDVATGKWLPTLVASPGSVTAEAAARVAADSAEAATRGGADTTLQSHIDAEASTRAGADTGEAAARAAGDSGVQGNLTTHAALTTGAHGGIVASTDARMTDRRLPLDHAASHSSTGGDAIAGAIAGGASGLLTGADKTKLDNTSGTNTGDQVISDATLTTTDITTNDVSITKHGLAPKLPNDATKFFNGVGAYAVPAGGMTNPMTAQDDLIVGGVAGAAASLAKGADSQVLTVNPSTHHVAWVTPAAATTDVLMVQVFS